MSLRTKVIKVHTLTTETILLVDYPEIIMEYNVNSTGGTEVWINWSAQKGNIQLNARTRHELFELMRKREWITEEEE